MIASDKYATDYQQASEKRHETERVRNEKSNDRTPQDFVAPSPADDTGVPGPDEGKVDCELDDAQHFGGEKMDCEQDDFPYMDEEQMDREQDDASSLDEAKEDCDHDGVPYDRGWAWMVVVGNVINYALVSGYVKCGGVFFVELLRRFQAPASKTALLFAIRGAVFSLSGLFIMNALVSRLGCRKTVLIGAAVMSLSAILSSLANELILLICLQAVLLGIADAMLTPPGEVLAAGYFRKRRALALAFIKSGGSVGTIVFPPLLAHLMAQYGLRGALLLTGAVCLHSFPATLLLRPLSYFRPRGNKGKNRFRSGMIRLSATEKGCRETAEASAPCLENKEEVKSLLDSHIQNGERVNNELNTSVLMNFEMVVPDSSKSKKCAGLANGNNDVIKTILKDNFDGDILFASNVAKDEVSESRILSNELLKLQTQSNSAQEAETYSLCNTKTCSSAEKNSTYNHPQLATTVLGEESSVPLVKAKLGKLESSSQRSRCAKLVTFLDFSLFRRPSFCLFFAYFMLAPCVIVAVDYLPALAQQHGVSEEQVALLLSIIGGLDLFSRLLSGVLADLKIFPVPWMVATVLVILGLTYQCVRFLTSFQLLLLLVVAQGLLAGVVNCMHSVLILHVVGLKGMAKTLGFQYLAEGAFSAALHPFLGYIRDVTGSYAIVYHVTGCSLVLAAVLLLVEEMLRQREEKRQNF